MADSNIYKLCLVHHRRTGEQYYEVLYEHPRKGWCFRGGDMLSTDVEVLNWVSADRAMAIAAPSAASKKRPDGRISRLVAHMREVNGGWMDGSEKENRHAANTLLLRALRAYPEHDPEEVVRHLIDAGKRDPFHGPNVTSLVYLVRHGGKIINHAHGRPSEQQQRAERLADIVRERYGGVEPSGQ